MIKKEKILKINKQPSTWRGLTMVIGGIECIINKLYIAGIPMLITGIFGIFDDEIGKAAKEGIEDAINDIKKHI